MTAFAKPNALHSAASVEWGTPDYIWQPADLVLGSANFDPCAARHFQRPGVWALDTDGEKLPWPLHSRIILNPPGGLVNAFWERACDHSGPIVWVGFSVEQLATLQDIHGGPLAYPTCILRKRVKFMHPNGKPSKRPSHANFVSLLGANDAMLGRFEELFKPLGKLCLPWA